MELIKSVHNLLSNDTFSFVFQRLTYSLSIALALSQRPKKLVLMYFTIAFTVVMLLNDYLQRFAMPIILIILTISMILAEKEKPFNALFITTNVITTILVCILLSTIIPALLFPAVVGTIPYSIIIGIMQCAVMMFCSRPIKKYIDIPHSMRIKLLSIFMLGSVIALYGIVIPLINDISLTQYAWFSIFIIGLILYTYYVITYLSTTYESKKEADRELETVSDVLNKALISVHYSEGLAKTITAYIDNNDLEGMKNYFYKTVEPYMNAELKHIDTLNNLRVEPIKNLIYITKKRADSKQIPMNIEVRGIVMNICMATIDLFKVMNIYFDNAIEASEKCINPFISVIIQSNHSSVSIEISNRFNPLEQKDYTALDRGRGLTIAGNHISKYGNVSKDTQITDCVFTQRLIIGKG